MKTNILGEEMPNRVICIGEVAFFASKIAGICNTSQRQLISISHIDEHFFLRLLNSQKL
jgi:hypothetical protein